MRLAAVQPVAERLTVEQHDAVVSGQQPVQAAQQCRLAGAGRPDEHAHLAAAHRKVDAVEHEPAPELLTHVASFQHDRPELLGGCERRGYRYRTDGGRRTGWWPPVASYVEAVLQERLYAGKQRDHGQVEHADHGQRFQDQEVPAVDALPLQG
ncbi:hypothetical protein GCM10029963_25040 [Micromonospora andamanensis]